MSKKKTKYDSDEAYGGYDISVEEYVKNQTEDDYLSNEKTRNILIDENQYQYDMNLRHRIAKLYYDLNLQYNDHNLFLRHDQNNEGGDSFADFIYNLINTKYNLHIFQKDPEWTITLFK